MADSATKEALDCTTNKQKPQLFQIAKLKLPTLLATDQNTKSQFKLSNNSWHIHFDLRSEAKNATVAFISNKIFRTHRTSGGQGIGIRLLQKPGFIPNNPLNPLTALFSEIQQEMAVEARKFYLIKSEYLKECIKRSKSPAISRTIETPETSNTSVSQLKHNLGFLVRLLFEIMEGPDEDIKFKAACEIPLLPDIYSIKESKAACDNMLPSLPDTSVKHLTHAPSDRNVPISGFNSLFNKRK